MRHEVASEQDIREGRSLLVEVDGFPIALFKAGGKVYAMQDMCPHQATSLSEGEVEDCKVTCPGHGWQFDLKTGECINGAQAQTFTVIVENGKVFIEL